MTELINRRTFVRLSGAAGLRLGWRGREIAQTDPAKLQLALVGCAHIHTPGFVNLLKARRDVAVKYVWDHDAARAAKRAGELESRAVEDVNEIWNDLEVAAVLICSETNRHPDLVFAAAKARKHMFVEKPLATTGRDSLAMAQAIAKANVHFTTGYFQRCSPVNLFIKEQVDRGNFGQITRVRGSNCHAGSLNGWFDTEWRWMADPKIAGVGAFGDLGTHSLDILMWLVGGVEAVAADIKAVTGRYRDCDESGEALIRFRNGVTGTLAAGWVDVADPVSLLVSGTEGHAAVINDQLFYKTSRIPGADGKRPWTELPKGYPVPLDLFVDTVTGQQGLPLVSPLEAAARVVVMEAMYESARGRKWVRIT
ncbi:MAG: Gfo/Idh/MocA family protein [Acidobacteriota bacterium]